MLVLLALERFDRGFNIALVFFGGCCLAIGWLIFRSTFLPVLVTMGVNAERWHSEQRGPVTAGRP
jgi:Domain of unknown function (DUF4386)